MNGPRSPVGPRRVGLPGSEQPRSPVTNSTTQPLAIPGRALPVPGRAATLDGLSSSAPITPAKYPGLGSGHTRLRLVSGGGRKVSPGRETVPLRGDSSPQPRRLSAKRQHSEDELQPRKRSDSRSPLNPIEIQQQIPLVSPSSSLRKPVTPRKESNGTATPVRRSSIATLDAEPIDHADAAAAIEAARTKVSTLTEHDRVYVLMY